MRVDACAACARAFPSFGAYWRGGKAHQGGNAHFPCRAVFGGGVRNPARAFSSSSAGTSTMQAFPVIQEVKLLTWTPANVYRLRYRPSLWGSWLDRMEGVHRGRQRGGGRPHTARGAARPVRLRRDYRPLSGAMQFWRRACERRAGARRRRRTRRRPQVATVTERKGAAEAARRA